MPAPRVTVIDYGAGNLFNLRRALVHLGAEVTVSADPAGASAADRLALPGVGAFGALMDALAGGLGEAIVGHVRAGRPFLGICLGMQMLFDGSDEAPDRPGLGLLPGRVERFTAGKVPHIGWNDVRPEPSCRLIAPGAAYFVHSYRIGAPPPGVAAATCDYHGPFTCGIERDTLLAVQFHPERSGAYGLALLEAWLRC